MRKRLLPLAVICLAAGLGISSCEDETSVIGGSLVTDEVSISVDSSFTVTGAPEYLSEFDARSGNLLLGSLKCPEYGELKSSFVARLMPAVSLDVADSITALDVDSMKIKFSYRRNAFTGDSLAPMQLKVYQLTKQIPSDISSSFNPTGYFNPSAPLGVKNYAATALGMRDSLFLNDSYGHIAVKLPLQLGRDIFSAYRTNPSIFQWPQEFAKYFPGIYVESSFGSGCVLNITVAEIATYYHYNIKKAEIVDGVSHTVDVVTTDSVTLLSTAPETLSSNILRFTPSASIKSLADSGIPIVSAPVGYVTKIKFPAQQILDKYWSSDFNLAVINNLVFSVPATTINNDYGILPPPYLLMVKSSELHDFFAQNKVPDSKTSFWGSYDSDAGIYTFSTMRQYIVDLMLAGKSVAAEDEEFTIVPVNIVNSELANDQGTIVTKCVPYILRPAVCRLDLDNAKVKFTFSSQLIP